MTDLPPQYPGNQYNEGGSYLQPHRGTVILVLGILGIVVCFICGIIAWMMANNDLREMEMGRMDPSGLGMTKAGKICGMIGVVLAIIGSIMVILLIGGMVAAGPAQFHP